MILTDTEIVCPSGDPDGSPSVVDLVAIFKSEARQDEVAIANKSTAQELAAEFLRSWRHLDKQFGIVRAEKLKAERHLENRKAQLLVNFIPSEIKAKGLASNDATRNALITLDIEAAKLQDTFDQIEGVYLYLQGKMHSFERAHSSAHKIMGDNSYMSNVRNPNLSGGAGDSKPQMVAPPVRGTVTQLENQQTTTLPPVSKGWGKAKY
jgi:hypothetical protein